MILEHPFITPRIVCPVTFLKDVFDSDFYVLSSCLGDPCSISKMLWSWLGLIWRMWQWPLTSLYLAQAISMSRDHSILGVVCLSQTEGQPGHSVLVLALLLKLFQGIHLILSSEFKKANSIWKLPSATERWWVRCLLTGKFWLSLFSALLLIAPEGWLFSLNYLSSSFSALV